MHCPICLDPFQLPIVQCTSGHSFCKACIDEWLTRRKTCPLDNGFLDKHNLVRNLSLEAVMSEMRPMTKVKSSTNINRRPQRPPSTRNPRRHWSLYVVIFSVMILGTAILFHRASQTSPTPPKPVNSFPPKPQPINHPPSGRHPPQETLQKLPFSSLLYQFCEYCIDFIHNVITFIYHFFAKMGYYIVKCLRLMIDGVVQCIVYILNWNWTSFFTTVIQCTKLFGSFLYMSMFTFYKVASYATACALYVCATLTKGCILMIHFCASLVLHVTEYVGVL